LPESQLKEITRYLHHFFPKIDIPPAALAPILDLSLQDKKNREGQVMCTLLDGIGGFRVDQLIDAEDFLEGISYYLETASYV
jgi:3-dehydroquinate synthase